MITAGEIFNYINEIAPFDTAMSFDNAGLLIGSADCTSEKVLLALDVTTEVVEEAVKEGAKIIVSHHPIIFNPLKKIEKFSVPYLVVQNDITVISAHTNLDIADIGVNNTLAEALGVISENKTNSECLLFGELEKETDCREFAYRIKSSLLCNGLRDCERTGSIKKICVSCGAGGSNIFDAVSAGADAFVTGEIKHHEILFAYENNISVFDIGHFRSEDIIIPRFVRILSEKFRNTVFKQAKRDTDVMMYI